MKPKKPTENSSLPILRQPYQHPMGHQDKAQEVQAADINQSGGKGNLSATNQGASQLMPTTLVSQPVSGISASEPLPTLLRPELESIAPEVTSSSRLSNALQAPMQDHSRGNNHTSNYTVCELPFDTPIPVQNDSTYEGYETTNLLTSPTTTAADLPVRSSPSAVTETSETSETSTEITQFAVSALKIDGVRHSRKRKSSISSPGPGTGSTKKPKLGADGYLRLSPRTEHTLKKLKKIADSDDGIVLDSALFEGSEHFCTETAYFFELGKCVNDALDPSIRYDQVVTHIMDSAAVYQSQNNITKNESAGSNDNDEDGDAKVDEDNNSSRQITKGQLQCSNPPLYDIKEIFRSMAQRALHLHVEQALKPLNSQPLRIVTMCSGTESPILSMKLLQQAFLQYDVNNFTFRHLASAEIEPFKQAYIERNFSPPVIFRDVTEFKEPDEPGEGPYQPHTAYGGRASKPAHVHILIAGSSCVDYSRLNSKPKEFGAEGESWSTMTGICAYVKSHRPNIVILENVQGADWNAIVEMYEGFGYAAGHVLVNSKDYYIPQTRNRGYMIAFNKDRVQKLGLDHAKIVREWQLLMEKFEKRASAPYTYFIDSDDEVELGLSKRTFEQEVRQPTSYNWAKCRVRYAAYRGRNQLGSLRPLSLWQNNGSCTFPDSYWQFWLKNQVERIWDTLDINFLRHVADHGYDMTYKNRFLDLSQNVDRESDRRHWGIVGCITPSGIPFETFRGGPITGREALRLQGIPVDDLILSTENSRQLQDLAGNAMTTTVVGAAILSAIIAAAVPSQQSSGTTVSALMDYSHVDDGKSNSNAKNPDLVQPKDETTLVAGLELLDLSDKYQSNITVERLLNSASRSRQLCLCEGSINQQDVGFLFCRQCGHTVCFKCHGHPKHDYAEIDHQILNVERTSPEQFIAMITKALPRSVQFAATNGTNLNDLAKWTSVSRDNRFAEPCKKALFDQYRFAGIKRDKEWRIQFKSLSGILELRFVPQLKSGIREGVQFSGNIFEAMPMTCYWLLFVHGRSKAMTITPIQENLASPIARMSPQKSIFHGMWMFQTFPSDIVEVTVIGQSDAIPVWETTLGLRALKYEMLKQYPAIKFTARNDRSSGSFAKRFVKGSIYHLLTSCGGANGSLYREAGDQEDGIATFLFLNPEPMGDDKYDRFVFSHQNARRSQNSHHDILGYLPELWRTNNSNGNFDKLISCEMTRWVAQTDLELENVPLVGDEYAAIRNLSIHDGGLVKSGCGALERLLVAKVPLNEDQRKCWRYGRTYPIDLVHGSQSFQDLDWLLKTIGQAALSDRRELFSLGQWRCIPGAILRHSTCRICYPPAPDMTWKLVRNQRGKSVIIRPFEDAEKAAEFERALKARPTIISSSVCGRGDHATIVVDINLVAMMHRVQSLLQSNMNETSSSILSEWRISIHNPSHVLASFPHIELLSCSHYGTPSGCPGQDSLASHTSTTVLSNFKRKLQGRQERTLNWLQTREMDISSWLEQEQLEIRLPNLDWCIEARARRQKSMYGGILADEVGSGKTTTMLALIATDDAGTHVNSQKSKGIPSSRIWTEATLILVPANILDQWSGEIEDCFLNTTGLVLTISSVKEFVELKIADLRRCRIILSSWDVFDQNEYWFYIRYLAGAPNVPERPGRALHQWHTEALESLGEFIIASQQCEDTKRFFEHRDAKKDAAVSEYTKFDGYLRRKDVVHTEKQLRISGLSMDEDLTKQRGSPLPLQQLSASMEIQEEAKFESKITKKDKIHPLFHMFDFRRVIVDEFTYLRGRSLMAVLGLTARSRWLLSGTPTIADYDSVNTMAKLLGTKISTVDEEKGCFGFGKDGDSMNATKSYAEEFHHYRAVDSVTNRTCRYELAQKFVAEFVRQDKANLSNIHKEDHVIIVNPSALELMQYMEFLLPLQTKLFQFGRSRSAKSVIPTTRKESIEKEIEHCDSAEQALVTCQSILRDLFGDQALTFGDIRQAMETEFIRVCQNLESEFCAAFWCDECHHVERAKGDHDQDNFEQFVHRALSPIELGDSALAALLNSLLRCAYDNRAEPKTLLIDADLIEKHNRMVKEYQVKLEQAQKKHQKLSAVQILIDSDSVMDDEPPRTDKVAPKLSIKKPPEEPRGLHRVEDLKAEGIAKKEIRARITLMNSFLQQLMPIAQSLRVLKAIESMSLMLPLLACSICQQLTPSDTNASVNIVCGHVFHKHCLSLHNEIGSEVQICQAYGCKCLATSQTLVSTDTFSPMRTSRPTEYGSVMTAVLQQIRGISHDDNILIFVQHATIGEHLVSCLKAAEIEHVDARKGALMSAKGVRKFKDNIRLGKKGYARVLILAINTADSAGWNLQEVNHVMFVKPLVTKSQHDYDSIMKQAIGRAYRYRQKKDVHVYHFAMSGTVEVNILEDRRKQVIVKRGEQFRFVHETELGGEEVRFNGIWHKRYIGSSMVDEGDNNGDQAREAETNDE